MCTAWAGFKPAHAPRGGGRKRQLYAAKTERGPEGKRGSTVSPNSSSGPLYFSTSRPGVVPGVLQPLIKTLPFPTESDVEPTGTSRVINLISRRGSFCTHAAREYDHCPVWRHEPWRPVWKRPWWIPSGRGEGKAGGPDRSPSTEGRKPECQPSGPALRRVRHMGDRNIRGSA